MKRTLLMMSLLALTTAALAQSNAPIRLWAEDAPGALGKADKDIPTLTAFLPEKGKATGAAVVICPGGGYQHLAPHEGQDYALFLNQSGVAGFVLKYRLGAQDGYQHPAMMNDGLRAIRYVRAHAAEWGVDPKRIGIMGSSAGGHLAATVLTHFDAGKADAADAVEKESSRPDFGVLCYAVISMGPNTHQGSKNNSIGRTASEELVKLMSNELQVTSETPPCFIWHTFEDNTVKIENSLDFAAALRRAKVPFDLHIYTKGGHGIGLKDKPPFANVHPWGKDLVFWLKDRGISKQP